MLSAKHKIYFFLLLALALFTGCDHNTSSLKNTYKRRHTSFDLVAGRFLGEPALHRIRIVSDDYNSGGWNSINHWSYRPGTDEKWWNLDTNTGQRIYLNSLEEVLRHEGISKETHTFYTNFLKEHRLSSISKVAPENLEIEAVGVGLRYIRKKVPLAPGVSAEFKEGKEYLKIEKINDQWYVYYRDWN